MSRMSVEYAAGFFDGTQALRHADNALIVRLESSLADDATFSGTVYVEELV